MNLSGNEELLDRPLVAFFASRTAPEGADDLARQWAYEISLSDKVVISGFHSPIERLVLDILLSQGASVVVAIGRSLYHKIPSHLQSAYDEGRVLFISFRDYDRPSFSNSQLRNWAAADLAEQVIFAPFEPSSQLATLYYSLSRGATPALVLQ
ncbi:MAG: hypothetical protein IJ348_05200 [Alistipes sp.]|nr:hypothetical protein [Alistipes sp.]